MFFRFLLLLLFYFNIISNIAFSIENTNTIEEKTAQEQNIVNNNDNYQIKEKNNAIKKHSIFFFSSLSLSGLSLDFGYYYNNFIGLRFDIGGIISAGFLYKKFLTSGQNCVDNTVMKQENGLDDLDRKDKIRSYGLYLSIKPFKGTFHIDGGLYYLSWSTYYTLNTTEREYREFNGFTWKKTVPHNFGFYTGVGWDIPIKFISISIALGVGHIFNYNTEERFKFVLPNDEVVHDVYEEYNSSKYFFAPTIKIGIGCIFNLPF